MSYFVRPRQTLEADTVVELVQLVGIPHKLTVLNEQGTSVALRCDIVDLLHVLAETE